MKYFPDLRKEEWVGIAVVLILFLTAGYISQAYKVELQNLIGVTGGVGMMLYMLVTVIAIVVAPLSTFPLLPIAVALWGSLTTALLSVIGWTIGAVIAYIIARRYGRPLIGRMVNLRRAQDIAESVAGKNLFWALLLLRIIIPVEILSYAFGLFINISLGAYTLATFLGVIPFALIFSYAAGLSVTYQIGALLLAAVVLLVAYKKIRVVVDSMDVH